ncbi:olfactory receptor 1019 [Columba livia]|uniref:Olfactory receptor n=1 Tax=Columba livia TaxID=8932 RepID=A0A2I0LN45_COLLI|nr:olfactory receptor 1019 [Columba livia]PKK18847.1 olfactory receptor 1019 [Columba livia]
MENQTKVTEFILVGFPSHPGSQLLLSILSSTMYAVTVIGNACMIFIIRTDSKLHTPMYFFLENLSILDICYSSVITPKAALTFSLGKRIISYNDCASQMFFFSLFGTTEAFFLAVMAYDRFTAVCNPLLYKIIMNKRLCVFMVVGSYLSGCINCTIQTGFTFSLSFCGSKEINHFFCDVPAVMYTSCSDTLVNEIVMLALCGSIIVGTALVVFISYGYIIITIVRMPSAESRLKAFSTCSSHMLSVCLFFGTVFFMYAQPGATSSPNKSKAISILYTIVIPMLNPFIYTLRNKEVKESLKKKFKKKGVFFVPLLRMRMTTVSN